MTRYSEDDHSDSAPGTLTGASAASTVIELLARKRRGRDSAVHPEVRKVLERILDRLTALEESAGESAARAARLREILETHGWLSVSPPSQPSEEQAWALADSLQALWIRTAGEAAVDDMLRRQTEASPPENGTLAAKREWLLGNQLARQRLGSHQRARTALRARYLRLAGYMLMGLVTAAMGVALVASDQDGTILLCGLAGAIGGTLAGARSLRDTRKLQDAQFFQTWWWVQPVVGVAVGLFIYALLESAVLALPGSESSDAHRQSASRIIYAFVGGFSEPFLLGVMGRIGGAADKAADASSSTRVPDAAPDPPSP